jgi:hypothetical protein
MPQPMASRGKHGIRYTFMTCSHANKPQRILRTTDRASGGRSGGLQQEGERVGLDAEVIASTPGGTPKILERNQQRASVHAANASWLKLAR